MLSDLTPNLTTNFVYVFSAVVVALITNITLIYLAWFNRKDNQSLKRSVDTGNGVTLAQAVGRLEQKVVDHIQADDFQFRTLNHILERHDRHHVEDEEGEAS